MDDLTTEQKCAILKRAREDYADGSGGDIEVDDDAGIADARADSGGCWVQAWVWVNTEDKDD